MVSLVLVSHSQALADALVPLIREMADDAVQIAIAAGAGDDGTAFGTDAVAIMQAIESVDSPDGVLVLGDMGSALLSTDTALDLLPEETRARTRLLSAPFVEGAMAAAIQASMGSPVDDVVREAQNALAQKQRHVGDTEADAPSPTGTPDVDAPDDDKATTEASADAQTAVVELVNPHGLHARPAAQLVRTAGQYDAAITLSREDDDHAPVSATSISSVSTLGARQGDRIQLSARGADAADALEALTALIRDGFGETEPDPESTPPDPAASATPKPPQSDEPPEGAVQGIPVQAGTAVAPAARFSAALPELPTTQTAPPEEIWDGLRVVLASVQGELETNASGNASAAGILDAQALLLDDDELLSEARRRITNEGEPAARAWHGATEALAERYAALDDAYLQARAADVRDVGRRVILELLDQPADALSLPDDPCILVADTLPPSVVPHLNPDHVQGVVCTGGSPTAHNAILLRGQGIPTVFGVGTALQSVDDGTPLGLDGAAGRVWIDPAPEQVEQLQAARKAAAEQAQAHREAAQEPAITADGIAITVQANVSQPEDAREAAARGAEGVGLLRTEFLFGDAEEPPSENDQVTALKAAVKPFTKPVTIRALDAGGDKPLPYLSFPDEANPFLGVRGIRVLLRHPELFQTQLRALLRTGAAHPVRLLLPMVATPDEVEEALQHLETARTALANAGTPHAERLPVGIMIETPASALAAEDLAPQVDFFSIGTNDLVQYVMAADRGHADLAALADVLHPPVLRLIQRTVQQAGDVPVSVCGEAAAQPMAIPLLLGLGVSSLSVNPGAVPGTKALVRALRHDEMEALATEALGCARVSEVRALVRKALPDEFAHGIATG